MKPNMDKSLPVRVEERTIFPIHCVGPGVYPSLL